MRAALRTLAHHDPLRALAAACRLAYVRGLVSALAGNASVRLGGGYACTPAGCCLGEVLRQDLVVCGEDWAPAGDRRPTSEWRLHARIYDAAASAGAVIHTHSPAATVMAVQGRGLQALTPEIEHFLGAVPCVPFAPPGTDALGVAVAAAVRAGAKAAILERHGAVTWGPDVRTAYHLAELLEAACVLMRRVGNAGAGTW